MPTPYETLGLPLDAEDAAIRTRYLELIREFPPEHQAERFAAIRVAYEKVKDLDARSRYRLFEMGSEDTIDSLIEEASCRTSRTRFGLTRLLTVIQSKG